MDEASIIEVFEHERDDEVKPLGIVSVRGTLTYAKIRELFALLSQAGDNFKETSLIETIKDKIPRDVLGKWMIECNRICVKLRNATIPRDDKFELRVEDFFGKTTIRLWCNECGEPYGVGSTEAKVTNVCLNKFLKVILRAKVMKNDIMLEQV